MSSVAESARRLIGLKPSAEMYAVAPRTFLRWADAGLVPPGLKIGGRRLWSIETLEQHISGGAKPVRKGARS